MCFVTGERDGGRLNATITRIGLRGFGQKFACVVEVLLLRGGGCQIEITPNDPVNP